MNMASGHSSMSSSSSPDVDDIVWELVKKPFSATAQQNIIVKQIPTPDLSTYPIGKGFQMLWYSKNGFVDLFSSAKFLLAVSFVLPWYFCNLDENWL
jgi:hypothetical protein